MACIQKFAKSLEPTPHVSIALMTSLENFRLTVFREVAKQRSFRKAADGLYLS
jgi:hypothetical protein